MLHERVMRRAGGTGGSSQCSCTRQTALLYTEHSDSGTASRGHGATRPHPASTLCHHTIMHCLLSLPITPGNIYCQSTELAWPGQCTGEFQHNTLYRTLPLNVEIDGGVVVQFTKYSAKIFANSHLDWRPTDKTSI